jgi:predicted nucleic acid-binding protein
MSRVLVVDASVAVDLLARFRPEPIETLLWADDTVLAAPELITVEALQALRRLDRVGAIPRSRTSLADLLRMLPIRTYRHGALLVGMWKLRSNLSAYDAAYVALARVLQATLVTRDSRLASAPDLGVPVEVP